MDGSDYKRRYVFLCMQRCLWRSSWFESVCVCVCAVLFVAAVCSCQLPRRSLAESQQGSGSDLAHGAEILREPGISV